MSQRNAQRRKPLVYCSIRFSGLSVVKLACDELRLHFSKLATDMSKARVVLGLHEHELQEVWLSLRQGASVGRLFGADLATDKGTYTDLVALMQKLVPGLVSDCFLDTWVLPRDLNELRVYEGRAHRGSAYILKPRNSSEGNGIRLLLSIDDVGREKDAIVQRYIASPMLLGGLKFDLRLYVLLRHVRPLEMWLCREGLVRFCTERYEQPSKTNLHQVAAFLTNYSLNKRAAHFVHSDDPHGGESSKRSLSATMPRIVDALPGIDEAELRSRLAATVANGMVPLVPFLVDSVRQQQQRHRKQDEEVPDFFQLFGVDVLLDANGAAWFLEVNSFPSMSLNSTVPYIGEGKCCRCMDDYKEHVHVESPVDRTVKLTVMRGALSLLLEDNNRIILTGTEDDASGDLTIGDRTSNTQAPFIPLALDGASQSAAEALGHWAVLFGRCCKAGSSNADPFRLRKCFLTTGCNAQEIDLQLRQQAQQPLGLSFLPVSNLLFATLRHVRPDVPLLDALVASFPDFENAV